MTMLGRSIVLKGEVRAAEDMTVEGRVDGPITCEGKSVIIARTAEVTGNVIARDITVFGQIAGQLVASEVVDIRADATVSGQVISPRFILQEAAQFNGRVTPQHLEAALRINRYNMRKRNESEGQ
jgi:cytoskeletal protein CcmA (bactofilin family)